MERISVYSNRITAKQLLFCAAFLAMPVQAQAGNLAQCTNYSNQAVAQQGANISNGCGFGGPRWQAQFQHHFIWCMGAPTSAINNERAARQNMLNNCIGGGGGGVGPNVRRFNNPKINGVRLDWCRVWAGQCGGPAANAFCRRRGYDYAINWSKANNIGNWTSTRVISSGAICSQPECDGFNWIRCGR